MPSDRLRADRQLTVMRALCMADEPLTAAVLHELTAVPERRCGLVPVFLLATGLITKGPARSGYVPTELGQSVGRAWAEGEQAGLKALREAWKDEWFTRTVMQCLGEGPRSRQFLVFELCQAAHAPEKRMSQVHVLVDLLVAVGMLVPEGDGRLSWPGGALDLDPLQRQDQQPSGSSRSAPESGPQKETQQQPGPVPALEGDPPSGVGGEAGASFGPSVPRPRREQTPTATNGGPAPELDLLALLLPPVLLADLARLSAEDLLALHGHLRGLAEITTKLRSGPVR
ncbi:hypothetical protein ADK55_27595 [Streptomyces sp. WM4235]|nr:hypothetical protein ADK55_27595 [Streptomyces sp. WM4235]